MKNYYVKEKGKFKKTSICDFPSQPTDGIWLVCKNGSSRSCVALLSELPFTTTLPTRLVLGKHKDELCKIVLGADKPRSINDVVDEIIDYIGKIKNV